MMTAPLNGQQKATTRVSAEYLQFLARKLNRCGDIHPLTGYVCVTQPHDDDVEHMAVQIGGPNDGKVYMTWGGHSHGIIKPNTNTGISHHSKRKTMGKHEA